MKHFLLILLFLISTFFAKANATILAPSNDECSNATSITVNTNTFCNLTTPGTIDGATDSGIASNGDGTPNDDVWFTFVATRITHIISMENIMGTYDDLVHEVFDGNCNTLTSLSVSDPDTSIITGLTVGNTYYLRVYGYSFSAGRDTTFEVCVKEAPTNNDFAEAQQLLVNTTCTNTLGTLNGATPSGAPFSSCGSNDADDVDVWYSFVSPSDGNVSITTSIGAATDIDTVITLYSYDGNTLTEVTCDDDGLAPYSLISIIDGSLIGGNTYYIKVHELYGDNAIAFNICITGNPTATINDLTSIDFSYYPNPVSDVITLKANKQINTIYVFNSLCQKIINYTPSDLIAEIDMTNLDSGSYFVKIYADNAVGTIKIFKK